MSEQPIEIFALQLARLMGRRDWRILRGLSHEDKDEVIARAVLAAWERRTELDTERGSVEVWFNFILRTARQDWASESDWTYNIDSEPNAIERLHHLSVESANPETILEAEQESAEFMASLSDTERNALMQLVDGQPVKAIVDDTGLPRRKIDKLRRRAQRIGAQPQRALPGERAPRGLAEDHDQRPSNIDREISAWLRGGLHRTTGLCRPCLACAWFDGFKNYALYPHKIVDAEVAKAIGDTLQRKRNIAEGLTKCQDSGNVSEIEEAVNVG